MPTPIILSVTADRSSWPLNYWCKEGEKRKSQLNKITWLLVLVWVQGVFRVWRAVYAENILRFLNDYEDLPHLIPLFLKTVTLNSVTRMFHMFLEATTRFLLNWQHSTPLWSATLTVHILYTHQTGGSLCTCQQGGSVWRHGPRLSKVCHQFFLPCHQSYLIPLCFLWEAFLPRS